MRQRRGNARLGDCDVFGHGRRLKSVSSRLFGLILDHTCASVKLGMLATSTPGRDRNGRSDAVLVSCDANAACRRLLWTSTAHQPLQILLRGLGRFLWVQHDTRWSHSRSLRPDLVPGAAHVRLAGDQHNILGVSNRLHRTRHAKAQPKTLETIDMVSQYTPHHRDWGS